MIVSAIMIYVASMVVCLTAAYICGPKREKSARVWMRIGAVPVVNTGAAVVAVAAIVVGLVVGVLSR